MNLLHGMNKAIQAFIYLRKGREGGGIASFCPRFLKEYMGKVNMEMYDLNVGFGNARFHNWKRITAEAYVKGHARPHARLTAFLDGDTPRYRLTCYSADNRSRHRYEFTDAHNTESGLSASMLKEYGNYIKYRL